MRFACLAILWLPLAVAIPSNSSDPEVTRATQTQLDNISLLLYTGRTVEQYTRVLVRRALDLLPRIDVNKPTVVYIHGWTESPDSLSVRTVIGAYLRRQDHNIIVVNWAEIASSSFRSAALSANSVGLTVASALNNLVAARLNPRTIHIVSHSLGSPVAGFVGRNMNPKVGRITGLDPSGPGFHFLIENLSANDAEFVDVIRTDEGVFGTTYSGVSVNFYPNGGRRLQPGCPFLEEAFCSHQRSWHFYAEALLDKMAFVAIQCNSWSLFRQRLCSMNGWVFMGPDTRRTARGDYYLQTNARSPFGRGASGTLYM